MRRHTRFAVALALLLIPLMVFAQGRRGASSFRRAMPYDGNLVFTRLIYGSGLGGSSALAITLVRALSEMAGAPVDGDDLMRDQLA